MHPAESAAVHRALVAILAHASELKSWVITDGAPSGLAQCVGRVVSELGLHDMPLIGVLKRESVAAWLSEQDSARVHPSQSRYINDELVDTNHSHFVVAQKSLSAKDGSSDGECASSGDRVQRMMRAKVEDMHVEAGAALS
jgi:hypothetical protein